MLFTLESVIVSATSEMSEIPQAVVFLPTGYTLTGGGAWDMWSGTGNLLTASKPFRSQIYPYPFNGWYAAGTSHLGSSPAQIVVYAIGIRIVDIHSQPVAIEQSIESFETPSAAHPSGSAPVTQGFVGTGGGALDVNDVRPAGASNMLTGSYPLLSNSSISGWWAAGKDHINSDPSYLLVYSIGIKVPDVTPKISVTSATGSPAQHPSASVSIPAGSTLISGGANDAYTGVGNLLTASYPVVPANGPATTWQANGKDQIQPDPSGTITVWAVSMKL